MKSETASSTDEQLEAAGTAADTRGRHRILAELKRVEQESKSLEEEMELLEKTDNVSTLCEELLRSMETRPDPLLPLTNGPINPSWDIWFEGPQDSESCRCQIL
ncbi:Guanine nucleotide-binding protein subunit gamma 1 [Hibiscus syriacus]|uniref:Guanine nucleotide-binding protein subunit gamma 1 n=1 Tax=Hibiscus syriacus TaxID=106335 RepID=A0A6A2YDF6_HIBSY|nr:guanine nucleotide-binding protein subunit gamma 2-like [Hibiscus syriacus]XP_039030794.1 guanine nucleotide-binding protein subunit gamma 2-like [Hibiscus syriacus]KAE8676716.1 Guanine nucleotide-binding protein subunit gamma 1 [Hibiscus syriacus]